MNKKKLKIILVKEESDIIFVDRLILYESVDVLIKSMKLMKREHNGES